jgi:predicted NAD/FAD-binding protein
VANVAVIGTGIAGMGCGYFLHREYDLTFYEQESYVGGHTRTVKIDEDGAPVPIDVGFIVYNEVNYPNLTRLFRELNVPTAKSSMSFSVQHIPSGLEFCGSGLNGLFGQRRNLVRPSYYRFLGQINRFNKESPEVLEDPQYQYSTLKEYVIEKGYGEEFLSRYLIPMAAAVWSMPQDTMMRFPAATLVRFFKNHGFLGLNTQHQWKTVSGGSWTYRDLLIAPFSDRIHVNRGAVRVIRSGNKATVVGSDGSQREFDKVIFACHADQALGLLEHPTDLESGLLKNFRYQKNTGTLHTDFSIMPRARRLWSSWNYRIDCREDGTMAQSIIYYMNSLQQVPGKKDYFVSINDPGMVHDEHVLQTFEYEHPIFSRDAVRAQVDLPKLNTNGTLYFCGSYFGYGFHEDAFTSALNASRALTGAPIWA